MPDSPWNVLAGSMVEGKYRLDSLLGTGGFGAVLLADHMVGDRHLRQVAVKLLPSDMANDERRMAELQHATRFDHSYILRCFDAGVWDSGRGLFLYLVMEVAEGSLSKRLQQGTLGLEEALDVARSIAEALAYLHSRSDRPVHKDIKPDNVLRVDGRWKLADFGTVREAGTATSVVTACIGTLFYMPPESFENLYSSAWDMWSLGVLLVEALNGALPFTGNTEIAIIYAIRTKEPSIAISLPVPFGEVVRGCLEKDRHKRWTAPEVLARLDIAPVELTHDRRRPKWSRAWLACAFAIVATLPLAVWLTARERKPRLSPEAPSTTSPIPPRQDASPHPPVRNQSQSHQLLLKRMIRAFSHVVAQRR